MTDTDMCPADDGSSRCCPPGECAVLVDRAVATLNVTTPDGVLLDVLKLTADDLRHPASIGERVIEGLPADLRPNAR